MRQIFRKVALERLSSPEQLDLLMQVTDPRSWIAFVGLAILLVAAIMWSVVTTLPINLSAPTVLHKSADTTDALLYLAPADSQRVTLGMPVAVTVRGGSADATLTGEVVAIGAYPDSADQVELRVALNAVPADLPDGAQATATIELGKQRPIELLIPLR